MPAVLRVMPDLRSNQLKTGAPSLLFCGRGGSEKASGGKQEGCNCKKCGVHKRYKLTDDYYCMK